MPLETFDQAQFLGYVVQRSTLAAPGSLLELTNAYVDVEGEIRSRPGAQRINTTALTDGASTNVHSHILYGDQRYVAVGAIVKRGYENAHPTIISGLSGNRLSFVHMSPSVAASNKAFTYFANGQVACRKKDDATTTYNWGLDGPTASAVAAITPTVGASQPAITAIDAFASAYTAQDGIGTEAAATSPYETSARSFTVPASKNERFRRTGLVLNLSGSGEDAFIRLMLRVDNRQNLDHVEVALSSDTGAFTTNFYTFRLSALDFQEDNSWQEFKIRKNVFERIKPTGGSTAVWASIDGVQITVGANSKGEVTVSADDARMEADTHADGTYDYKVTLWNDTLKIRSNGRRLADIYTNSDYVTAKITVHRQRITVARPSDSGSWDSQASHWEIWRRNVTVGDGKWHFVTRATVATTTIDDDLNELAVGEALLEVNHIPPPSKFILGPFDNRCFFFGMSNVTSGSGEEESGYAFRWSEAGYPESVPLTNYTFTGDPKDTIQGGALWSENLFLFTQAHVYRVTGTHGAYVAIRTEAPIGTNSPYSVSSSPQGVFYRALDGIYLFTGGTSVKISLEIDPLFRGETVTIDGLTIYPVDGSTPAKSEGIVGSYFDSRYVFTYTDASSVRTTLWYHLPTKRWHRAQNTTANSGWNLQRLRWEKVGQINQADNLEGGSSDGWLMLLDSSANNPGVFVDGGAAAIAFAVQLKAWDAELKSTAIETDIKDLAVDVDTGGQTLTVQASFDGAAYTTIGTVSTASRDKVFLPVNAGVGTIAFRCAVRITGTLSTARVTLWSVGCQHIPEPKRIVNFSTDFDRQGWVGEKILQELQIEANTFSNTITVTVEADGTNLAQTFTLNTAARKPVVFSFNFAEPRATELRLKFTAAGSAEWKLYHYQFQFLQEPLTVSRIALEKADEGWPGEKLFKSLDVEIDPLGTAVSLQVFIDEVSIGTVTTPATTGRTIYSFSLAALANLERRGNVWYAECSSTALFRLYRAWVETEKEPVRNTFWKTPIAHDGWEADKLYRTLELDINTYGVAVTVTAYVDGTIQAPSPTSTNIVNTANRQFVYISYPSPRGRASSLTLSSGSTQFSYYGHTWDVEREPLTSTRYITVLADENWEGEKLYKEFALEFDPIGSAISVALSVDGVLLGTFTTSATGGRQIQYFSLASVSALEQRGRLSSLDLTAVVGQTFRYYRHWMEFEREPIRNTFWKTPIAHDGWEADKLYRTLALDINTYAANVTVTAYVDGTVQAPSPGSSNIVNTASRQFVYISYPNPRGRASSITLSSASTQFSYYGHTWDVEREPLTSTRYITALADENWEGEKLYKELALEYDPIGSAVTCDVYVNGTVIGTFTTNATGGRQIQYFSLASGSTLERRGRISFIDLTAVVGQTFRYYRHWMVLEREPVRSTFWKSDITDAGYPGEKRFRTLRLDIQTFGATVTATPYIDGTAQVGLVSAIFTTVGRQEVHISLADVRGRNASLVLSSGSTTQFALYTLSWDYEAEGLTSTYYFTQWTEDGYAAEKALRQCFIELDTQSADVTLKILVDGATVQTNTLNTTGRRTTITSLLTTPEGRLFAITLESVATTRFRFFKVGWEYVKRPPGITFFDTTERSIFGGLKGWLRRLLLSVKAGSSITGVVYVDQVSLFTFTVAAQPTHAEVLIQFPIGLTGRLFRVTFTVATGTMQLFENSYIEAHPLEPDREFSPWKLIA